MSPPTMRPRRSGRVVATGLVAIIVLNECVTRGYVTGGDGRPLVGADVWLADSATVVHALRTDARGFSWVVHAPLTRRDYRMLICQAGHSLFGHDRVESALYRSEYGIGAYTGRFPETPADLGWVAPAPPSCPSAFVPSAS